MIDLSTFNFKPIIEELQAGNYHLLNETLKTHFCEETYNGNKEGHKFLNMCLALSSINKHELVILDIVAGSDLNGSYIEVNEEWEK